MEKKTKRVTLADVAKAAGVSAQAVSKIVNGGQSTTNVSESTKEAVLEAAAKLGYRPNTVARAVRQGRIGALGVLVSNDPYRTYLPQDLIFGLVERAESIGMDIKLAHYDESALSGDQIPRFFREVMVDGLLIDYFDNSESTLSLIENLKKFQLPAIWLNRNMPEDSVYFDDYAAGSELADMMHKDGLRNFAYIDTEELFENHYSRADRMRGFSERINELGADIHTLCEPIADQEQVDYLSKWLEHHPDIEAVASYSTGAIIPVMQIMSSLGRRIGADYHIGFLGSKDQLPMYPRYVMVQQNRVFGKMAVDLLMKKIEQPSKTLPSQKLGFTPMRITLDMK